jgi:hypothetical protein
LVLIGLVYVVACRVMLSPIFNFREAASAT